MSQNKSSSTRPRITSSVMAAGLIGPDLRKERCPTCRRRHVFAGSLYGIGPQKCYGTRASSDSVWRRSRGVGDVQVRVAVAVHVAERGGQRAGVLVGRHPGGPVGELHPAE